MKYTYHINLDERGDFYADVRHSVTGESVYEIRGFEIFDDGYMKHKYDIAGLQSYLQELGIIPGDARIIE
jgi:hypothetical protein